MPTTFGSSKLKWKFMLQNMDTEAHRKQWKERKLSPILKVWKPLCWASVPRLRWMQEMCHFTARIYCKVLKTEGRSVQVSIMTCYRGALHMVQSMIGHYNLLLYHDGFGSWDLWTRNLSKLALSDITWCSIQGYDSQLFVDFYYTIYFNA